MTAPAYTTEILRLASGNARFPFDEAAQLVVERRSRSCGSTLRMGIDLDGMGRIRRVGFAPHMCAFGQAASTLFAQGARDATRERIEAVRNQMRDWLDNRGERPDWPGIEALDPVLPLAGRHGAVMLPFEAACAALQQCHPAIGSKIGR